MVPFRRGSSPRRSTTSTAARGRAPGRSGSTRRGRRPSRAAAPAPSTAWPSRRRPSAPASAPGRARRRGRRNGRFPLLVRGVVRLVDHDETEVRQGREDGRARADDGVDVAAARALPLGRALAVREAAVEERDPVAEARDEPPTSAGASAISGTSRIPRRPAATAPLERREVDLGLPAARDAVEEELPLLARRDGGGDHRDRVRLRRRRDDAAVRAPGRRAGRGRPVAPPRRRRPRRPSRDPRGARA